MSHIARWWTPLEDGRVRCDLCPRECTMRDGQRGFCFVRANEGGQLVLTTYGRSSGFAVDPIEKKPLNHFHPGSTVLSFGTAGCNLGCKFCQNWEMSKSREMDRLAVKASPSDIAAWALQRGCASVAFTYNDPVIFAEYALDTATACREAGVHTVAVTAGYINSPAREEFFAGMDAANIDLKGFTESFYRQLTGASLATVLDTISYVACTDTWLELTTLLIPGKNDSDTEIAAECEWIVENVGPEVPLHFSAFHPAHRMLDVPRTPRSTLTRARQIALDAGLRYVYTGNVHDRDGDTTVCPDCGTELIVRDWYRIIVDRLTPEGRCPGCGLQIPGRFAA